jgi:glutamine amidotransferase
MLIEILDLGVNNLKSITKGIASSFNGNLQVIDQASQSKSPSLIVLPGVGSFGAAMQSLRSRGFDDLIANHLGESKRIFGVCLGMQLMFQNSHESPEESGLAIFSGEVSRLDTSARVPNVGWLEADFIENEKWTGNNFASDFYFVHSYAVAVKEDLAVLAKSLHGTQEFASAVKSDLALGVQFHPEKSSRAGHELLRNIVDWSQSA